MKAKVIKVNEDEIFFDNGFILTSEHEQDCCESYYLSFHDITIKDFEGLEFDLTEDNFFERIPDYGIALLPLNGFPVRIPGYGRNNGYYSSNMDLVLYSADRKYTRTFNIIECQVITD